MKHTIWLLSFILLLSSCATTRKFTITGEPGTIIKKSDLTEVGTIGNDGKLSVEFKKAEYEPFWVAFPNGQDKGFVFGLDCEKFDTPNTLWKLSLGSYILGVPLMLTALTGNMALMGIGATIALSGCGLGFGLISAEGKNDGYEYNYRYSEQQSTNDDLIFTKIDRQKLNTKPQMSQKVVSQKSSSALSLFISKEPDISIQGKYSGSGSISLGNKEVKKFSKIFIDIICSNETTALVDVYDDSGMHFFDEKLKYTFKRESNGGFTLTNSEIKTATISISDKNELSLIHPNIEIQGDAYILSASAKK